MGKPAPAPVTLAYIATLLRPPKPLDFLETYELLQMRSAVISLKTYKTEREELDALRAIVQCELEVVRALTQDLPWYANDPIAELLWRRPFAEAKAKAEETAREETARLKREAEEERLVGLRAKKRAE